VSRDTCKSQCGDGLVAVSEECDDGNLYSSDGCTNCAIDDGFVCSSINCTTSVCAGVCGDGISVGRELKPYLGCDDGNTVAGDGCSEECQIECGFSCDNDGCTTVCGDGRWIESEEACDDGNSVSGDGKNDLFIGDLNDLL
jgi:cysteine-rich repeat protein